MTIPDIDIARLRGNWQKLVPETMAHFETLWQAPELGCMEVQAAGVLTGWLAQHGFRIELAPGAIPTAFIARKGNGPGPRIAILAEYDALPGLGNRVVCHRAPTGQSAGQACGHNHIGPANTAAAIAAASLDLPGEIAVIGCPAEEILWGKIALLHAGAFDGFDAILTSHGDYQNGAISRACQAVVSSEFVFLGEAGHGGKTGPRNALLTAENARAAITERLGQSHPDVTIKHVYRNGGNMPSITPDEARLWITCRNVELDRARSAYREVFAICRDEAARAGTTCREQFISECRGYLANDTLARVLQDSLETIGPPAWTDSDINVMRNLAEAASPGEGFTLDRGLKLHDEGADYYGQDDGEVSWRIPLGRVNWAYPEQVPIHHWAWTVLSGHPAGHKGALMASESLALAAARLLANPLLVDGAKAELAARTKGLAVDMPRLGARQTMREAPQSFWDATWVEAG